ncbi:hypothetical protein Tco_0556857 [Tanacetum coccineum]
MAATSSPPSSLHHHHHHRDHHLPPSTATPSPPRHHLAPPLPPSHRKGACGFKTTTKSGCSGGLTATKGCWFSLGFAPQQGCVWFYKKTNRQGAFVSGLTPKKGGAFGCHEALQGCMVLLFTAPKVRFGFIKTARGLRLVYDNVPGVRLGLKRPIEDSFGFQKQPWGALV